MAQNFIDTPVAAEHDPRNTPADPNPPRRAPVALAAGAFLLLILLGAAFVVPRFRHHDALVEETRVAGGPPPVELAKIAYGPSAGKLELPGTVQAFEQTPVYARTSGYVTRRLVDIGDRVQKGQLLATIDDPQTTQQLRQAEASVMQLKAQLAQAAANAKLTTLNDQRYEELFKQGVVSRQTADTQQAQSGANDATVQAARANISAGEANVRSLEEQAGF